MAAFAPLRMAGVAERSARTSKQVTGVKLVLRPNQAFPPGARGWVESGRPVQVHVASEGRCRADPEAAGRGVRSTKPRLNRLVSGRPAGASVEPRSSRTGGGGGWADATAQALRAEGGGIGEGHVSAEGFTVDYAKLGRLAQQLATCGESSPRAPTPSPPCWGPSATTSFAVSCRPSPRTGPTRSPRSSSAWTRWPASPRRPPTPTGP